MVLNEHAQDGPGVKRPAQRLLEWLPRLAERSRVLRATRRHTLFSLLAVPLAAATYGQESSQDDHHLPIPKIGDEDTKLPNGKSQRDEIARQQHADALKDVDALVAAAEELRDELKHAGDFVVPVASLRKTEEIEKLAKKIRGRLKS